MIGGSGRVGSSAATKLLQAHPQLQVTLASRSRATYEAAIRRQPILQQALFQQCNVDSEQSVKQVIAGADLIVHAAGPFQRSENHIVLEQAIAARTAYMDVSDDSQYSQRQALGPPLDP